VFKRPSKMNSEELWGYIMTGSFTPDWVPSESDQEKNKTYQKYAKGVRHLQTLGEYAGLFFALCVFGVLFWGLFLLVYPLAFKQAMALPFIIYLIGKILIIPQIRFWRKGASGKVHIS